MRTHHVALLAGSSFRDKPDGPALARAFAPFDRDRVGELPALAASLRAFANDASRPLNARVIVATYALYDGIHDDWVDDTEPGSEDGSSIVSNGTSFSVND